MAQAVIKNNYFDFKITDAQDILDKFKTHVNKYDCPEITLDLSSLNVLDAAKVMLLSSAYHFRKYPSGKVRCHVMTKNVKDIVSSFIPSNLELV